MHRYAAPFVIAIATICGSALAADPACAPLVATGKLRAGMNLSNTLFTTKDPASGELRGVSVDLMREIAKRLGVPVENVVYKTPGEVADDAANNKWDVAVLAIEPARATAIAFSPPMTEIEATYAVRKGSAYRAVTEMDAPGVRIATANKAGYELYLTRTLKNATIVRTNQLEGAIEAFNGGKADTVAGLRPAMLELMPKFQDARLLEGNFMTVNHGVGVPKDRGTGGKCIDAIVAELNASGFVARSIAQNNIPGLAAVKAKP